MQVELLKFFLLFNQVDSDGLILRNALQLICSIISSACFLFCFSAEEATGK